jgi:hypothetical protein
MFSAKEHKGGGTDGRRESEGTPSFPSFLSEDWVLYFYSADQVSVLQFKIQ